MEKDRNSGGAILTVLGVAFVWLAIGAFLVAQFWPRSKAQWVLLIAFGPPLYVLGEGFFGWLLSPSHGRAISPRTFSLGRILLGLAAALILFLVGQWLSRLLASV